MNKLNAIAFSITMAFSTFLSASESNSISPDRPGIGTGTHTVGVGTLYLEAGYQYSFNRSGIDTATHTFPQFVLRTGITEDLEFNFMWEGWNQEHVQGLESVRSESDVILGVKYSFYSDNLINLSFLSGFTVNSGSSPSKGNHSNPYFGVLWDYNLSENIQLFGQGSITQLKKETNDKYEEYQLALGLGFSHSNQLSSFIEYYSAIPNESLIEESHILNSGFTYLYDKNTQYDISVGLGLNEETSNFIGLGIAKRF